MVKNKKEFVALINKYLSLDADSFIGHSLTEITGFGKVSSCTLCIKGRVLCDGFIPACCDCLWHLVHGDPGQRDGACLCELSRGYYELSERVKSHKENNNPETRESLAYAVHNRAEYMIEVLIETGQCTPEEIEKVIYSRGVAV